jgi:hypothetical protein
MAYHPFHEFLAISLLMRYNILGFGEGNKRVK